MVRGKYKLSWPLTSTVSGYKGGTDLHSETTFPEAGDAGYRVPLTLTVSFAFFKCKSSLKPQTPTKGSWKMEGVNRG